MVQLEDFKEHLEQIPKEEWEGLAGLLPCIKQADTFGVIEQDNPLFLTVKAAPIVEEVMGRLQRMRLFPVFEWISWLDGQRMVNQPGLDYGRISSRELGMLLTVIFRLDKFNEGYLVSKFEDGMILGILEELVGRHR